MKSLAKTIIHIRGGLLGHPGYVCTKGDLIRVIWPEDVIFQQGIRDKSLS